MLNGIEIEVRVGDCKIRKPTKHAENQYTLISTDDGRFFAFFKDGEDKAQISELTEEIYQEMLKQARADEAYLRWNRRHMDDEADVDTLSDKKQASTIAAWKTLLLPPYLWGRKALREVYSPIRSGEGFICAFA